MIQSNDYIIKLHTGEIISVLELDVQVVEELSKIEILEAASDIVRHCCKMPRSVVEDAKLGHTKRFTELMKSPERAMLKLKSPICAMISECSQANVSVCTTKNIKDKIGKFPICWEFKPPKLTDEHLVPTVQNLVFTIVHAWREGKIVILVDF